MAQENKKGPGSISEVSSPQATASEPEETKPRIVVTTIQDPNNPAEADVSGRTAPQSPLSDEDHRSPSKKSQVRVQASRRSTETGDSRGSKPKFGIRWPGSREVGPGIHWYTPTMMISLAFAGLFGGLGHHLYNAGLEGQPVIDAQWPQRWGVAMAFFVKMTLVGAVQIAVKQRAWLTVKKRGFRVRTLDSIFHACYDPLEFLDKDLFIGALFSTLLALLVWVLPLSAIASPSTLTVANGIRFFPATCTNVSTLDFSRENGFGLNHWDLARNKEGMSFWDSLDENTYFFNQPSMDSRRNFQLSLLSDQPLQPDSPCPTDSNCTFAISFTAPSYKCEHRDSFGGMAMYNMSQMAPFGDLLYASYSSIEEDFVGRPLNWNRSNPDKDTGVFTHEPSLWVAWTYNTSILATKENATQWNTTYWPHQLKTHIMECSFWNSTYSYTISYNQGKMSVNDSASTIRPDTLMLPPGSVMDPHMENYMEWAGFHGTGWLYRSMLAGNISQRGQADWVMTQSNIGQTNILDPGNGIAYDEDLAPAIENSFHRVYLSFLADVKQESQVFVDMPCEASAHLLVWHYNPTWLAVSYFIAVGVTFIAVGVGLHAIAANGYVAQTNFSTFLITTRNPDLDKMAEGSCLGAWPLEKEVCDTRLRFGQTTAAASTHGNVGSEIPPHAAFGFVDRVTSIEKGKKYV